MFEDDETLRMYVDESLDHLGDIENDLLSIEQSGADIDVDLVNNVFRAAHSIKGGAGFMGLVTIKELSHSLENVLGLIREKELVPDSEKISILLNGFDKLEEMLNDISHSNDEDVSNHIEMLSNITKASLSDDKLEAVSELVDIEFGDDGLFVDISLYEIQQHKEEGKNLFIVEYDLITDIQLKNKNPLYVLQNIEKTGTIIDSKIDFVSIGTLDDDTFASRIPFQILFSSIIEFDMASTLFEIDETYIHLVTDDMIVTAQGNELSKDSETIESETTQVAAPEIQPEINKKVKQTPAAKPTKKSIDVQKEKSLKKQTPVKKVKAASAKESAGAIVSSKPQTSLRVNVNLLDTLMNLAGELVLSRNQLLQGVSSSNEKATEQSSQRIDMITSELQEAIMRTRMQPIGNIFTKFTRIVRDMSRDLEKSIDLHIEGQEVELDKTILESINDPLTHLIRNSVDHGIESPVDRERLGKDATGKIELKAFHEAGQVNIEISDDGKGLDPEIISTVAFSKGLVTENQIAEMSDKEKIELIFMAGFSTAEKVTDVSGRGVGMDVVMTNIELLGGIIELDSTPGKGTTTQIKLPLTLAIIPSQIAAVGDEKYAIPQVNLDELLRIPASDIKTRVEKVGDADVVRLRGELLPLLNLAHVLGVEKTFINPEDQKQYSDRRENIADRRSKQLEDMDNSNENNDVNDNEIENHPERQSEDRRYHASSALNIAVVSAGAFKYGLVVDELLDSEEIVVKPVGRHLKKCAAYAGATIMGDGRVALILDISSLAQIAELTNIAKKKPVQAASEADIDQMSEKVALLTFRNNDSEYFAAPLNIVERIERIEYTSIEEVGNRKVVQYRGGALPLYEISQAAEVKPLSKRDQQEVIVFKVKEKELGLMVTPPVDALEINLEIDESTLRQSCITGSMIINEKTTLLIDIFEFMKQMNPEWFQKDFETKDQLQEQGKEKTILFAEDSAFFRNQVKSFMAEDGFNVLEAEDGQIAWELLKERADDIDIVVTDLEMPNMDGFELTKKIKETPEYSHFTVIALTSLASESHIQKGRKVGIDEYEIKLDREKLMKLIKKYLNL